MTPNEFVRKLLASYPPGLRPDTDYAKELQKFIEKRKLMGFQKESVTEGILETLAVNFKMFPSFVDVEAAFREAHRAVSKEIRSRTAWEYFYLGSVSYRRDVGITESGDLIRKPLPEGATGYYLELPDWLKAKDDALTLEQAIDEGCISEGLYEAMTNNRTKAGSKSRFEKIGEVIRQESTVDWSDI